MEDFNDIDNLVKAQLSVQEILPSDGNWQLLQAKVKKEKQKRRRMLVVFFLGLCGVITFATYHFTNESSVTDSVDALTIESNVVEDCETLNSEDDKSLSNTNTLNDNHIQNEQVSKVQIGSKLTTKTSSSKLISKKKQHRVKGNIQRTSQESHLYNRNLRVADTIIGQRKDVILIDDELSVTLLNGGGKKKEKTKEGKRKSYGEITLIAGVNNFFNTSDYNFEKSYYIEVGYLLDKKLKKDLYLNYGPSISFSNLSYQTTVESQTRQEALRELSFNAVATFEKRVDNFRFGLGGYFGYNLIEPKNRFLLDEIDLGDISRTFIYGVSTNIKYQKIGLTFKYELSPYYEIGAQKNNRFILGVLYVF